MLWKVCGMKEESNIRQVAMLRPDFMGFIFYPHSPRYVGDDFPKDRLDNIAGISKVGVFVDQETSEIVEKVKYYDLDYVQLHGSEPVSQVEEVSKVAGVINVVSGNKLPDTEELRAYEPFIDYWLMDTRLAGMHGGTGQRFDWQVLDDLELEKGIILSGGIGPAAAGEARRHNPRGVVGVDVNSKAEMEPGVKDVTILKQIYNELFG